MKNQTPVNFPITDEEIEKVCRATAQRDRMEPRIAKIGYDRETRRFTLQMRDGTTVGFASRRLPSLQRASHQQLAAVQIREHGASLHWNELDVQTSTIALLQIIFRFQTISDHARRAGSTPSLQKARAARANGLKGGRPKVKI